MLSPDDQDSGSISTPNPNEAEFPSNHGQSSNGVKKKESPLRRDELALQTITTLRPELYVDMFGEPMICLPLDGLSERRTPCRLRSDRARAALFAFVRDHAGFVPFVQEIARITWVLEDMAWRNIRTCPDFTVAIEQHDLLEAVNLLLHTTDFRNGYDGTASRLRNLLNDLAIEQGIDLRQRHWPRGSSRLSQQLWELKETLRSGGIQLERGRTNGARWIKLTRNRSDDGPQTASPLRPPDDVPPNETFEPSDDGDGVLRALLDTIDANYEEKK